MSLLPTGDGFCLGGLSASFVLKKQRALLDLCPGGYNGLCQSVSVRFTPATRSASNIVVLLFDITESLFALTSRTLRHDCRLQLPAISYFKYVRLTQFSSRIAASIRQNWSIPCYGCVCDHLRCTLQYSMSAIGASAEQAPLRVVDNSVCKKGDQIS